METTQNTTFEDLVYEMGDASNYILSGFMNRGLSRLPRIWIANRASSKFNTIANRMSQAGWIATEFIASQEYVNGEYCQGVAFIFSRL